MNIQQLNGSGQKIWVFFTTAIAMLLMTGGSWLCFNRLATHEAIEWYQQRSKVGVMDATGAYREGENWEKRDYGFLLRVAMLIWLVRNGRRTWMWNSGAWIAIAMNSNARGETRSVADESAACHYVSTHSWPGHDYDFWFPNDSRQSVTWSPLPR